MEKVTMYNLKDQLDEYDITDNINEALFIDYYGNMQNAHIDMGMRGMDHNNIIDNNNHSKTHEQKWNDIHMQGIIRLVPETLIALIRADQPISDTQKEMLKENNFTIEYY